MDTVFHLYSSDALAEKQWTCETSENGWIWTKSAMATQKISRCCWCFCCLYSFLFLYFITSMWRTLNDTELFRLFDLRLSQDHDSTYLSFSGYLLHSFAAVLLVGVIVLMPLALVCKIWWGNWRQRNTKVRLYFLMVTVVRFFSQDDEKKKWKNVSSTGEKQQCCYSLMVLDEMYGSWRAVMPVMCTTMKTVLNL